MSIETAAKDLAARTKAYAEKFLGWVEKHFEDKSESTTKANPSPVVDSKAQAGTSTPPAPASTPPSPPATA